MSDAATMLLAQAWIKGWKTAMTDRRASAPDPDPQLVVDFLFREHRTVVTQAWVNELLKVK